MFSSRIAFCVAAASFRFLAPLVGAQSGAMPPTAPAPAPSSSSAGLGAQEEQAATNNAAPGVSTLAAGAPRRRGIPAEAVTAAVAATPDLPPGPYVATWESVSKHQPPAWFQDGKFGIGMHWGLYAVPAHGSEWYFRHMYANAAIAQWHAEKYGPQDQFGYKDFIPLFTAAKFNADEWVALFKKAGARYVMPSAEHHDGFSLWDSAFNKYNAKAMGPRRDLIGELATATHQAGLKFGVTNHSIEHFDFLEGVIPGQKNDLADPAWTDFYSYADRSEAARTKFYTAWLNKNFELIDKYQLDTLWWDNGINPRSYDPMKLKVFAWFYNRAAQQGREVTMLTKGEASLGGHVQDYERMSRAPATVQEKPFEIHDSPGFRWGYLEGDTYWPNRTIIGRLIDIVSRNGNFLFNLGPRADGTIPDEQKNLLLAIGRWLDVNGDAIYGTRAWKISSEGNIRYTTKGDTLYAMVINAAAGADVTIPSLAIGKAPAGSITKVEWLGVAEAPAFTQDESGLKLKLPAPLPSEYAVALKITGLKLH